MRDNSGSGKSKNNNQDPTLRDNAGQGGTGKRNTSTAKGEPVIGDVKAPGEDLSPGDRARGETSRREKAPPTDR